MNNLEFKKRVLFIGMPDMAFMGMDTLLYAGVNIVGVLGPMKSHSTYNLFKEFTISRRQNFIEYDKLDSQELLDKIRELNVDIAVVCSFNNKFPKVFIDLIKDGIINIHPSLLPKYRGGNPYSWVIINGERETGVTLHFISEEFDEGDIIAQEKCPLLKQETMGTLFNKTNQIGCSMLLKAIIYYENNGYLPRKKQDSGVFVKAPNFKDEELYIDYYKSAEYIERFLRSLNPYLTPMTMYNNHIVNIYKVSVIDDKKYSKFLPGVICDIKDNKVYIKTQSGCIVPEVMQIPGLFFGNSSDFISIIKPKIGDKFTNG